MFDKNPSILPQKCLNSKRHGKCFRKGKKSIRYHYTNKEIFTFKYLPLNIYLGIAIPRAERVKFKSKTNSNHFNHWRVIVNNKIGKIKSYKANREYGPDCTWVSYSTQKDPKMRVGI